MKRLLPLLVASLSLLNAARADLAIALSQSVQNSARGQEVIFSGNLTNTGSSKLYLNDIATTLNAGSTGDLALEPKGFFSNVPGVLLPGETYTDDEIFRVLLMATAPTVDYRGTVTIRGGTDIFAATDLANTSFVVLSPSVDLQVTDASASEFGPDPASWTITRSGGTEIDLVVPITSSGSAVAGFDYQTLPVSVTIPAGFSYSSVTLMPIPNNIAQGDRTAQLTLVASNAFNLGANIAATVIIHDKPADEWRFEQFGANANGPAAADLADWDGDGIVNLVEFALNMDPKNGGSAGLPTVARVGDDLTLSFSPNPAATDVTYIVEGSPDLLNWSADYAEFVAEMNPGGTLTYRYKDPLSESGRGFLRLRVQRTDL